MKFERYSESKDFLNDVLEVLREDAAINISVIWGLISESETSRSIFEDLITEGTDENCKKILHNQVRLFWNHPKRLLATVKDSCGSVLLTAYCNHPYKKLTLYATRREVNPGAVKLLIDELKSLGYGLPRIWAERSLTECFKEVCGGDFIKHSSVLVMQADKIAEMPPASGFYRIMNEKDLFFAPFWQAECLKACNLDFESLDELHSYLQYATRDNSAYSAYLWEDKFPVSQAIINCEIDTCSQISDVYTPPFYRKKGYATSLVSALTHLILTERGKRNSMLLSDADNPTSCSIYRKIGYREVAVLNEVSIVMRRNVQSNFKNT